MKAYLRDGIVSLIRYVIENESADYTSFKIKSPFLLMFICVDGGNLSMNPLKISRICG